jgi:23S rRNA pseudouridine2605 synthase
VKQKATVRRIGLARALSKPGYCSRSQATKLIRAGRVRLNGRVQRDPETPVRLACDQIDVGDRTVEARDKVYLMMNKPRGVVTTASDEKGRQTVYSVLSKSGAAGSLPWVAPVGRLDRASEGLLLLTNDSEWGARIAAPETHLPKTYHVQIATVPDQQLIQRLMQGIKTQNGEVLRANAVRMLRSGKKSCWLEIVLTEGKNRQIRRMLQGLGVEVLRLVRVAIGPLQLGQLGKGAFRTLTDEEKRMLDHIVDSRLG